MPRHTLVFFLGEGGRCSEEGRTVQAYITSIHHLVAAGLQGPDLSFVSFLLDIIITYSILSQQIQGFSPEGQRDRKCSPLIHAVPLRAAKGQPPWARPPLVRRLCHYILLPRHTPFLSMCPPLSKANREALEPVKGSPVPPVHTHTAAALLTHSPSPNLGTHPILVSKVLSLPPYGTLRS